MCSINFISGPFFSEVVPHERYDDYTVHNDIALLKLKSKIDFAKFKVSF